MDSCSHEQFLRGSVVPCFDETQNDDIFDVPDILCPGLLPLERSYSLQSSTSSEPSTTSSSDVPASSTFLPRSTLSVFADGGLHLEQAVIQEGPISEVFETNDDGFFDCLNKSFQVTSVERGAFSKPFHVKPIQGCIDAGESRAWLSLQESRPVGDEFAFPQRDDFQLDSLGTNCRPSVGQSFPSPESLEDRADELLPDFPWPARASKEMPELDEEPLEDVSQMFAQWLQRNSHRFSLSDISKIRLRTSTIENGMKRLGGGKKGLLYFLKLLLSWIQAHHGEGRDGLADQIANLSSKGTGGNLARIEDETMDGSKCVLAAFVEVGRNVAAEEDQYHSSPQMRQEKLHDLTNRDVLESAATQHKHDRTHEVDSAYTHWYTNKTLSFQNTFSSSSMDDGICGWIRPATDGVASPLFDGTKGSVPVAANVGNRDSHWHMADVVSPSLYLQSGSLASKSAQYSTEGSGPEPAPHNTSAATTRAARMNRMERRKWSVNRNRTWQRAALRVHREGSL